MRDKGKRDRQQLHEQAQHLRERGSLKAAIEVLFDLLADDVTDGAVVTDLASTLAEDDQLGRAERAFRHAFKVAGDIPKLTANYGAFLARSGRQQELDELLKEKCQDLIDQGKRALARGEDEIDEEACRAIGNSAMNVARLLLEIDWPDEALGLALTFLKDPFYWREADEIVCAANEALEGDDVLLAWKLFDDKAASPLMVWRLMEDMASLWEDPVGAADVLIEATEFLPTRTLLMCMAGHEERYSLLRWVCAELERLWDEGHPQAIENAERLASMFAEVHGEWILRDGSNMEQLDFDFSAE